MKLRVLAEVTPGLEDVAQNEIESRSSGTLKCTECGAGKLLIGVVAGGKGSGTKRGNNTQIKQIIAGAELAKVVREVSKARTISAIYLVQRFTIPRPQALLGSSEHRLLVDQIVATLDAFIGKQPQSFRISAAGSDSSTFARIKAAIAKSTGLPADDEEGDLLIRIAPRKEGESSSDEWEVLSRLTSRPLSVRSYRKENLRGALAGPLAASLIHMLELRSTERVLNVASGSATMLIEGRLLYKKVTFVGVELKGPHLALAQKNIKSAALGNIILQVQGDACALPFTEASFNVVMSDLPWGEALGARATNATLYLATLRESARVTDMAGRAIFLTQDERSFDHALAESTESWSVVLRRKITQRGFSPTIFLLRRAA